MPNEDENEDEEWDMIGEEDKINEDPNEEYDSADDSANVPDEMSEGNSTDGRVSRGGVVEKMSPSSKY